MRRRTVIAGVALMVAGASACGAPASTQDANDGGAAESATEAYDAGPATSVDATRPTTDAASPSMTDAGTVTPDAARDASASGATVCGHEPAGFTRLTDRPFDAVVEDGWSQPYWLWGGGPASSILTIVQDANAPKSPPDVLQMRYPAGLNGGDVAFAESKSIPGAPTQFYGCMWIKYSANFVGNGSGVNKILFVWTDDGQYGTPAVILSAQAAGPTADFQPQVRTQDATYQDIAPNVPGASSYTFKRGAWVQWEWLVTINTPGSAHGGTADGVVRVWMNGVLTTELTNVLLSTAGSQRTWTSLQLAPYWGGIGGQLQADQYAYLDHLYASVR